MKTNNRKIEISSKSLEYINQERMLAGTGIRDQLFSLQEPEVLAGGKRNMNRKITVVSIGLLRSFVWFAEVLLNTLYQ